MSQPQPQTRPFADFVVPETNDADEDAVPEERKIKAEQSNRRCAPNIRTRTTNSCRPSASWLSSMRPICTW